MKNIELDSNKWGVRDIYDQGKLAGIPPQAMRLVELCAHSWNHETDIPLVIFIYFNKREPNP